MLLNPSFLYLQKNNMTKSLLLSLVLFLTLTGFSQSTKHQSINHTQILKLGVNTHFTPDEFPFSISWEKKIGSNESIQLGFLPRVQTNNDDKTTGIGFNIGYRKYISKNRTGINGLFISPIAKIGFLKQHDVYTSYFYNGTNPPQYYTTATKKNINQFSAGFVFGHNWVFKSGFSFEVSGGMAYFTSVNKGTNINNNITTSFNYKETGIRPQALLNFGYAF